MIVDPLPVAWRFEAIGAPWRIDTHEALPTAVAERITARIAQFDLDWSRFRDDSLVSRMAREPGRYRLPDDARPLLDLYGELYTATAGRVSPLVGRALESLGYDAAYRLTPAGHRAPVPAWADALAWDGEHLELLSPAVLDVGAAGKGYLVDLVAELLSDAGIDAYFVDASGDMTVRGAGSLRIALEHPLDPTKAVGIANLENRALCASAINRRTWGEGLHHVLDALTGEPTSEVIATWAVAPTALEADGAATALFFDTAPNFYRVHDVSYVRMFANGRLERTDNWDGELFT